MKYFKKVDTDGCENVTIPIFILTLALRQDILSKNVAVMTPHNHPPIRGVIVVTFFEKNRKQIFTDLGAKSCGRDTNFDWIFYLMPALH